MKRSIAWTMILGWCVSGAPAIGEPTPPEPSWERAGVAWDQAPAPLAERPVAFPEVSEFSLPNGLRVVVAPRRGIPLVSVHLVALQAGAASGTPGLAQLTGDLLTQGADIYTRDTFAERLEELGAVLEVGVGRDASTVRVRTLAGTLESTLDLLARMVINPLLPRADFERLRHSQLELAAQREHEPRRLAEYIWYRQAFGAAHPYAAPIIGLPDALRATSLQAVHDFHETFYQPASSVLIVVGDVSVKQVKRMLGRRFAHWQPRRPAPSLARYGTPPPITETTIYVFDKPGAEQAVVFLGTPHAAHEASLRAAVEVVNTALGGTFASRLNGTLREQLGYTYGISSAVARLRAATLFMISSSIKTANTVDALRQTLAIVERTRTTPLPGPELQKTKRFLVRSFPQRFETNAEVTGVLREFVLEHRPLATLPATPAELEAVGADEAQGAISQAWQHLAIVVVGDLNAIGDLRGLGLPIRHVNAKGEVVAP